MTRSVVPLQSPLLWFKFRSNIIGRPTFNLSLWFGIPRNFNELRNSIEYMTSWSRMLLESLHNESALRYISSSTLITNVNVTKPVIGYNHQTSD